MKRFYQVCGVTISVCMDDSLWSAEERSMAPFRTEASVADHIYDFEMVDVLKEPEGCPVTWADNAMVYQNQDVQIRYIGASQREWNHAYIRVAHRGNYHSAHLLRSQYQDKIGIKAVMTAIGFEHLIARAGGYILHCSYVVHNGRAILFTAPSETGKSTQAELWKEFRGARIINGDRAAVRTVDGVPMAEGIPFAGSSQYCLNESWPLAAVVYLGQAKETTIHRLRGGQAFSRIWEGCTVNVWDQKDVELVTNSVMQTISSVPVYRLDCTPDESAVRALEAML